MIHFSSSFNNSFSRSIVQFIFRFNCKYEVLSLVSSSCISLHLQICIFIEKLLASSLALLEKHIPSLIYFLLNVDLFSGFYLMQIRLRNVPIRLCLNFLKLLMSFMHAKNHTLVIIILNLIRFSLSNGSFLMFAFLIPYLQ